MKHIMTPGQFDRESRFGMAAAALNSLHTQGLVSASEYRKLRRKFAKKYSPCIGSYFAESLDL